jgi:hypothetical protein
MYGMLGVTGTHGYGCDSMGHRVRVVTGCLHLGRIRFRLRLCRSTTLRLCANMSPGLSAVRFTIDDVWTW